MTEDAVLDQAIQHRDAALAKARAYDAFINTYLDLLRTRSDAEFLLPAPRPRSRSATFLLK